MTSIADDFAEALTTVRQPGTFYVAGTEPMFAPGLAVQGVGPIALPLLPVQARLRSYFIEQGGAVIEDLMRDHLRIASRKEPPRAA